MRPRLLSRFFIATLACASIGATASDVFAQTQQLVKEVVRKFPEGQCPLDTNFIGSFVTDTGIIQLTFVSGPEDFGQAFDDISIIEAADFDDPDHQDPDPGNCYFDSDPPVPVYNQPLPNANAPFYDPFDGVLSPCAWDETDGFTVTGGVLQFTGAGIASTSVVISGLEIGTEYVIHGRWSAEGFPFALDCTVTGALCLTITVDDLEEDCGPLPAENKTWGAVKALYQD